MTRQKEKNYERGTEWRGDGRGFREIEVVDVSTEFGEANFQAIHSRRSDWSNAASCGKVNGYSLLGHRTLQVNINRI
jgi:hypothetical protein